MQEDGVMYMSCDVQLTVCLPPSIFHPVGNICHVCVWCVVAMCFASRRFAILTLISKEGIDFRQIDCDGERHAYRFLIHRSRLPILDTYIFLLTGFPATVSRADWFPTDRWEMADERHGG